MERLKRSSLVPSSFSTSSLPEWTRNPSSVSDWVKNVISASLEFLFDLKKLLIQTRKRLKENSTRLAMPLEPPIRRWPPSSWMRSIDVSSAVIAIRGTFRLLSDLLPQYSPARPHPNAATAIPHCHVVAQTLWSQSTTPLPRHAFHSSPVIHSSPVMLRVAAMPPPPHRYKAPNTTHLILSVMWITSSETEFMSLFLSAHFAEAWRDAERWKHLQQPACDRWFWFLYLEIEQERGFFVLHVDWRREKERRAQWQHGAIR